MVSPTIKIDRQAFERALAVAQQRAGLPTPLPWPSNLHLLETTPSTNALLWQHLREGAGEGTVAIAAQQTAGRGQWGRSWVSPIGGLYFSVALAPHCLAKESAQLTMAVGWGIANELRRWQVPVQLKWPNDLVLAGRKLGGILTETRVRQDAIHQAVVGVGINWANSPPEPGIALQTFLQEEREMELAATDGSSASAFPISDSLGSSPGSIESLEQLAAIALTGIFSGYRLWQTEGIGTLLPAYTQLLINLGHRLHIQGKSGTIVGVSEQGNLLVRCETGLQASQRGTNAEPLIWDIQVKPGEIQLGYPVGESVSMESAKTLAKDSPD